jgi:hypothetical protein
MTLAWRVWLAVLGLAIAPGSADAQDLDRDGVPDVLEQALLERFLPTLVLSAGECDGLPASMVPGLVDPKVAARDGTVYGHVAPRATRGDGTAEIELQYFHLWGRDCGRPGHALDVERVSTLVRAPALDAPLAAWRASYWYTAAHEGTVCDASSGAASTTVRATGTGPYVYVSRGKHASYLARGHCKWGCGSDVCDPGSPVPRGAVVNLGEREAPLNGATWMHSRRWALAAKLETDFDETVRRHLDTEPATGVLALRIALRPFQAPILGGDTGLDALIAAGEAAVTAVGKTSDATATAAAATGRAVATAMTNTVKRIAWFLRHE